MSLYLPEDPTEGAAHLPELDRLEAVINRDIERRSSQRGCRCATCLRRPPAPRPLLLEEDITW